MPTAPTDAALGERLAVRTVELIDIPSESGDESRLAGHVLDLLRDRGVNVRDAGDNCILAGALDEPRIVLAGHLDTVPAQGNRPGRRDGDHVHGLGASDMKGAVAVALELVRDGAPCVVALFPREELPFVETALTPLLERDELLRQAELVVMMEPTDNAIHAGCLGNINATWRFHGRSGHSARPWTADNAIVHAAEGILALSAHPFEPHEFAGLQFIEVASVTTIAGGIARNVIPDRVECAVNFRYAPGRSEAEGEARLAEMCAGHGELTIDANAPSGDVCVETPLAHALIAAGELEVAPKQAWTPVAEFTRAGIAALNFGPGAPAEAHRRDEKVTVAALVRSYQVLDKFLREAAA